jgi:hypothetical protein
MTYIYCLWLNCLSSPQCGTTSRRDLKGNTKVKNQARQSCSPAGEQISESRACVEKRKRSWKGPRANNK